MNFENYFEPDELVSLVHYQTFNDKNDIYNLFDDKLKKTITFLRNAIDKPFIINDWSYSKNKKKYNYRGFRWDDCKEGAEKSKHKEGKAIDFIISGMTALEFRKYIKKNANKLPYPVRIENNVTWNHLDICNLTNEKVYFFN